MNTLEKYICIFFIYAIAGWFMETFRGYFKTGKFINRGFLIGPYLPVYGFGVTLITIFLEKYVNDIYILFGMSIVLCGTLEYFTSWIMEKLFKARWWDYHNRKFNINGRICLETLIPFGILGTVLLKFANPFILKILNNIPNTTLVFILKIMLIIFIVDVIISYTVVMSFKKTAKEVENKVVKDNTEEMSKMVKEVTTEKVKEIKENVEDGLEEARENLEEFSKNVNVRLKYTKRKVYFTSKKFIDNWKESKEEIKRRRELTILSLQNLFEASKKNIKMHAEHFADSIKYKFNFMTNKEYTEVVKEKLMEKSWFTKRLTKAFPNITFVSKKFKNKK